MIDTQQLKERCDLRRLVEQDLGPAAIRGGRANLWKCPFHHERRGYSLAVWANGYRCFGRCQSSGDALDWLMNYRRLSFVDAAQALGEPIEATTPLERRPPAPISEPPDWTWQHAAEQVVSLAEESLWSSTGEPALRYLMGRGLSSATIRKGRLGYIPGDYRERRTMEGLEVPCGITIPWFAAGALWAVKVRLAYGMPKYLQITGGSAAGLYKADDLATAEIALFCEGEFDALLAGQEVGGLAAAVTLGSAVNTLSARWFGELIRCSLMLVAYDRDAAGEKGTNHLLALSPRFRPIHIPDGKDVSEFYLLGGDIYSWIERELAGLETGELG